eukprot:GFYU01006393.1.p2 GENE.GFYU01006393.1~~GFYU01006393.1.p2  ORF type:complete len:105 (+),score=22.53 GFYU01006393.1:101-415(+)
MSQEAKRSMVLLYRHILRTHRKKIPADMRPLGDMYVRDEFRKHWTAKEEFLGPFLQQWSEYHNMLKSQKGMLGKDMEETDKQSLSPQQKDQLDQLRREATNSYF